MQNTELRPLGAGEILDRAVTLYVRRFVLIVAVLAVVVVPFLIAQAVVSPGSGRIFDDMGKVMSASGHAQTEAMAQMTRDGQTQPLTYLVIMMNAFARLLEFSAVVAVIAAAYAGSAMTFGGAYRLALRRWLPQIVVALAYLAIAAIAGIPLLMMAFAIGLVVTLIGAAGGGWAAAVIGIVAALVAGVIVICLMCWVYIAYNLAAVAVVTESADIATAIGAGLRRAFGKQTRWRALVAGLIVFAISVGGSLPIIGIAATVSALVHQPALYYAIAGAGTVLLEGLVAAFIVVFATDVRVRREGLDLVVPASPAGV